MFVQRWRTTWQFLHFINVNVKVIKILNDWNSSRHINTCLLTAFQFKFQAHCYHGPPFMRVWKSHNTLSCSVLLLGSSFKWNPSSNSLIAFCIPKCHRKKFKWETDYSSVKLFTCNLIMEGGTLNTFFSHYAYWQTIYQLVYTESCSFLVTSFTE